MSFFFFAYLYPIRIFQEVSIKDLDIYLRFQKIVRLFLLSGSIFVNLYFIFKGYADVTKFKVYSSNYIFQNWEKLLTIFTLFSVILLFYVFLHKVNFLNIKNKSSLRVVDVSSPIVDLLIFIILCALGIIFGTINSIIIDNTIILY